MTPKDKAIELYCKYIDAYNNINLQVSDYKLAKQSALIAVDEILEAIDWHAYEAPNKEIFFLEQVKTEIEKL